MTSVADLQDAVARAVTTALRDSGYSVDSEDEADSTRCAFQKLQLMSCIR